MFRDYLEAVANEDINAQLAQKLKRLSKLETHGFKRLAYAKAATSIANLDVPITEVDDISSIPGVGSGIAKKIKQFISTGEIKKLQQREKTAEKQTGIKRIDRQEALKKIQPLINQARSMGLKFEICGSIRREEANVKDVDILALGKDMSRWYNIIDQLETEKINRGNVSTDFWLNGIAVNIRSCAAESWGAGLLFLTGPQMFNINMRSQAKKQGLLLSQHGLFKRDTREMVAGKTEKDIFNALGMKYIEPNRR